MKKGISILLILILVLSLIPVSSFAGSTPKVYIKDSEVDLKNKPYMENGFWMLPFKEVMDNLSIPVEFNEKEGKYIGYVDKWQIAVTPDSYKEEFDLVDIELENKTKGVDGDVYVQLEFFSKIYGSTVSGDENKISVKVKLPDKKEERDMTFEEYLETLPEPQVIFDMDDVFNHGEPEDNENRTVTVVDIATDDRPLGTDFDKALQMYNKKKHPNNTFYNSRITLRLPVELQQDDILVMQFWVRSIQATHESGNSQFDVNFEHATTYFKMFECMDQMVGKEWTKMNCAFRVTEHLMPNGGTCGFRIGFFPQTLQFADFKLLNYGKTYNSKIYEPRSTAYISDDVSIYKERDDTYYGREEGALWREEAFKRIEKYRVRDIKVNVTDKDGNPISDAKVKADMTRSEFHWGTMTQWDPAYNSNHVTPKFNNLLLKHFNAVSEGNALKKNYWEPYGVTLNAQFAQDNRLYNRCHVMSNGIDGHTNETLWKGLEEGGYMTHEDYVITFANWASMRMYTWGETFDEIDVRNEVTSHQADEEYYGPKVVADLFKVLNDISPDSILLVNEAGINGEEKRWDRAYEFRKILDSYMANGAPIDGVGFEAHFYFPLYPQISYNQMDHVLGDDMKYATWTEYDLVSTAKDPKVAADVEADFLRDAIIIAYSHPKTIGFHMWGFADPNHWRGNAPLYDWYFYQKKDAVKYWDEYVWNKWFTKTEGVTDENGKSVMRGHRGEYEISVDALGKSAKITLVVSDTGENTVNAVVTDEGIILTSSEEVNFEKKEIPLPLEAEYNERNKAELWKELYRSRVNKVVGTKGEDISFLGGNDFGISFFKDETRQMHDYIINQGESIVAKVSTTLDSGAVKIGMPDIKDVAMLVRIEGRQKDGEWKLIGKSDNLNPEYITFDFPVDEVKLTVEGSGKVHINNIHISQKGWIR